jgi:hypothetical protein
MHTKALDIVYKKKIEGIGSFLKNLKISHWMILSYPVFMFMIRRQRDFDDIYVIDTAALSQIVFNVIFGIYVSVRFFQVLPALKKGLFNRPLIWLLLYCFLAIVSALWSVRPEYTLYRAFEILIFLILITDAMITLGTMEDMIKFQLCFSFVLVLFWHLTKIRNGFSLEIMHDLNSRNTNSIHWLDHMVEMEAIHFILLSILCNIFCNLYALLLKKERFLSLRRKARLWYSPNLFNCFSHSSLRV